MNQNRSVTPGKKLSKHEPKGRKIIMKQSLLIFLLMITGSVLHAQKLTISGYIRDKADGEALIGATVYVDELKTGTVTNAYGFYAVSLPKGTYNFTFSYLGYEDVKQKIILNSDQELNIRLSENTKEINEVAVFSEKKDRNVESVEMSMQKMPVKLVSKLPSFMGEVDIIRSIQLLPGIQSGGEGSSGLYVRGGGPDENLVILDEAPVYNASHLLGFFSVFNADAIKDIQVYKGGIPAEYGGKASSVIDIRMKDGNSRNFAVTGGIGNISSRLTLEGPIIKDKWSFILSGRRTYADFLGKLMGIEQLQENKLYFYDLNGKSNIQLGDHDRLYLSMYTGDDYAKIGKSIYMRWGNQTGTVRWNHLFGSKLFSNTSLIYSLYNYNVGVPGEGADQFDWTSQIRDYNFKEDLTLFLDTDNKLKMGINVIQHHFQPGKIDVNENSYFHDLELTPYNAIEGSAYASNEQNIGARITMKYGLRFSLFQQIGKGKVREYANPESPDANEILNVRDYKKGELIGAPYTYLEPRFAIKYTVGPTSSVKASYNRMVQNLHLISNTNSPTPLDIWLPSNKYIKPLVADQVAMGYFRNFSNNVYETSVEVYYKNLDHVIDYIDGAQLFLNENIETQLLSGAGYAYGLEFLVKKQQGKFTGWISYTLARSMRKIQGINNGDPYPSSYDRTHDLSLVLTWEINPRWNVSGSWVFSTGNPTSYPIAKYQVQGNTLYYYAARNSNRIPDYHRLDLSVNYDFKKNEHRKFKQSLNLSLYNVYARRNAYSVTFRPNEDNPNISEAVRLSIIGTIIPALTYNFNF
ncbi:MAG TPA: TonB-dependent receptor [Bacteroidales bacterium]|nr:TonB-dependent receptor [Bacteroidales bacterium]